MGSKSRTFRLFVSSTFSDLKAERNALQERVFPRLRELCAQRDAHFQAIDLRWGVSEEASLDQQTMNICLGEIWRCQQKTPRPNFLVLLGDRYGWRPPPPQIPAAIFEQVLKHVAEDDRALLLEWYLRDDNNVPPEYCLQPRERNGKYEDYGAWGTVEARLQAVLAEAIEGIELDDQSRLTYVASATHQEIACGALRLEDAHEHVYCFFRTIDGMPLDQSAAGFLDLDENEVADQEARNRLKQLKQDLRSRLPNNVFEYKTEWTSQGVSDAHIEHLCQDVYEYLSRLIIDETSRLEKVDPLQSEIEDHEVFGNDRARFFIGRTDILHTISSYLAGSNHHPLAIVGASGSGKSALMAKAVERARITHAEGELVYRFIGSTPDSSVGRRLLEDLCRQVDRCFGMDDSVVPTDFRELVQAFSRRLTLATAERPIIIFLDALDQLSETNDARNLSWLPAQLPDHVRMVVSTIPGGCHEILEAKLPAEGVIELASMPIGEGEMLLDIWLEDADRTLLDEQRQEIIAKFEGCPRPLYLKLAFEEARQWKSYQEFPRSEHNRPGLNKDIPGILRDLFGRLSSEANHGKLLVSRSLAYLASGKNGLSEDELLDILARDVGVYAWFLQSTYHTPPDLIQHAYQYLQDTPAALPEAHQDQLIDDAIAEAWLQKIRQDADAGKLQEFLAALLTKGVRLRLPVVLWSRLYFDLEPYLAQRAADGAILFGFYHRQVGEVVTEDYLDSKTKNEIHQSLARYFDDQHLEIVHEDGKSPNLRKLSELPFQQAHGELWDELQSTLTDFSFLQSKLSAGGPQLLIDDYDVSVRAGYQGQSLPVIQNALRLSANVLARDASQLAGHIIGRLMVRPEAEIQTLMGQARKWNDVEWLCPLTPNLSPLGKALLRTLEGHTKEVIAVTGHPDGHRFISASVDGTLRLWNVDTGEELSLFEGHTAPVLTVAMFPDGKRFISGSKDRSLILWDLETVSVLKRFEGHAKSVRTVAVLPGGRQVISGSSDLTLKLWDVDRGGVVHTFEGHGSGINAVAVSSDGSRAVSGSTDRTLRVWDLETGKTLHVLNGHTGRVNAVVMLPDGRRALSGEWHLEKINRNLKIWDLETGDELRTLDDRVWGVHALAILPDGKHALAAIADGTIKVWDLETDKMIRSLEGHAGAVEDLSLTPEGDRIISASSDRTLKVWELDSQSKLVDNLDFTLPSNLRQLQQAKLLNQPKGMGSHALSMDAVAIFRNRRRAVSITNVGTAGPYGKATISQLAVWDLATGLRVHSLELPVGEINSLAIFPDGSRAISTSKVNTFQIWDLKSGKRLKGPDGHTEWLTDVALFGDGKFAVSASHDNTIRIWDLDAWIATAVLGGHKSSVNAVDVFPDERRLVSASEDKTLILWDLETKQIIRTLKGHQSGVKAVVILPEGQRIVSASHDGVIKTWDVENGQVLHSMKGHEGPIAALSFSCEGNLLISASQDKSIKVWNMEDSHIITTFIGEAELICCAAESDRVTIIAGDDAGQVHLLQLKGMGEENPGPTVSY